MGGMRVAGDVGVVGQVLMDVAKLKGQGHGLEWSIAMVDFCNQGRKCSREMRCVTTSCWQCTTVFLRL